MASASPSPWTMILHSSKPEIPHFRLSSFNLNDPARTASRRSSRGARRLLLLPRCSSSLNEESPVSEKNRREKMKLDQLDLGSAVGPSPRSRRRRRRPIALWGRIFFASKKVRSIILLNVLTVIYASDIPVLKEVEEIVDPALFTVVRFAVTAIPFLPVLLHSSKDGKTRSAGMELGLWVSLGYLSQALGLLTSEAGQASFLSAFTMIVVPLINGIFGAAVPVTTWAGALVSLLGVGILEYGGSPPCVGDILNLLSAVFFGVHIFRTEQISRSTKKEKFWALLGYQVSAVALSSAIWFVCKDMFSEGHQLNAASGSWESLAWWDWLITFPWIPAIYTGVFSTGLCLWAEMDAMRDVSATETAIIYGLEPVWGAAFAWFLLGERWDSTEWIGALLVLCGSLTVQIIGSPEASQCKKEDRNINLNQSVTSDDQKDFSLLTVVVQTKKADEGLFRKQDKL